MAVFAVVFSEERFQADGAYYLFKVINYETFQVEHQRFILIFSQVLPLIGVKLGLTLKTIFILNSISNVLFFYLVFCYLVYYLRDKTGGIAVVLFQVMGVLHLQFTPMYEIWYGTALLVPLRSHLVCQRYHKIKDLVLLAAFLITVLFSHPLLVIAVVFIFLLDSVENKKTELKTALVLVFALVIWYLTKKLLLSDYEAGKMSMLSQEGQSAERLLSGAYYLKLAKFLFTYYTIPILIFFVLFFIYLAKKEKLKFLLVGFFFLGHIFLVNYTHQTEDTISPYFERLYMPLLPVVFFPFLYDLWTQAVFRNTIGALVLIAAVGWRMGRFIDTGLDYKKRTTLVEEAIEKARRMPGSKFQLNPVDSRYCMNWVDWSLAMESQLRSAARDAERTIAISTWEDFEIKNNRAKLNADTSIYMMRCFEIISDESVNPRYFHIQHGRYVLLKKVCR